jgi:hypothetical protein
MEIWVRGLLPFLLKPLFLNKSISLTGHSFLQKPYNLKKFPEKHMLKAFQILIMNRFRLKPIRLQTIKKHFLKTGKYMLN